MEIFDLNSEPNQTANIIHIIEHTGYGTLHQLIKPLQYDDKHHVVCSDGKEIINFDKKKQYVLHCTGHYYPTFANLEKYLKAGIKIDVFMHVAPDYLFMKNKAKFFNYFRKLQEKYYYNCFCPSANVSLEYSKYGIYVKPVQIGFPTIHNPASTLQHSPHLEQYLNKYVTTCTNGDNRYKYIKGIDRFEEVITKTNNKDNALILGFNGEYHGIKCIRLNLKEFLAVLSKSKMYIQLSRSECYNVTAIQAKRLHVPVIVHNSDGHLDSMPNYMNRVDTIEQAMDKVYRPEQLNETIKTNYEDSIKRESIDKFASVFNLEYGGYNYDKTSFTK